MSGTFCTLFQPSYDFDFRNFKLVAPYAVKRHRDDLHFTYLDTTGRPVIVLEKQNLVDSHIQSFTVYLFA